MCVYFLFLLSIVGLSASDMYRSSVLVPAYETVANWRHDFGVNLFINEEDPLLVKNRLSLYSPGLILPTATGKDDVEGYASVVRNFQKIKDSSKGLLSGDHVVFNPPYSDINSPDPLKTISFGQGDDAFRMIELLHELKRNGLAEIDVDGVCLGFLRVMNALFALGHPSEYPEAEKFFTAAGIDRIDREKILDMIRIMTFNAPLKNPTDIVRVLCVEPCTSALPSLFVKQLLGSCGVSSESVAYLAGLAGSSVAQRYIRGNTIKNSIASVLFHSVIAPFTGYNSKYPSIETMIQRMSHYRNDYPLLSSLVLVKNGDKVVGDWDNKQCLDTLPVNGNRTAIIPSHIADGHLDLDVLQRAAMASWKKQFGGSYYDVTSQLQLGDTVLDFARKMQNNPLYFTLYQESMSNQKIYNFVKQAADKPKKDVFFDKEIEQCIDGTINGFNRIQKACL
jgi:hypothetical protein